MKVLRLGLLLVGLSALSTTTALVLAAPADPPVAPAATPVASAVALLRERLPHPPTVQVYASAGHALTVDGDHPPGFGDRIGQWVTRSGDSDLRQNLVEAEVRQDVAVPGQDPPGVAVQALLVASGPVGAVGSALLVLGAVRSLGRKRNPLGPLPLRQPDHLSRSTS